MDILYRNEHLGCKYYNQSEKPMIEVVKIAQGEKKKLSIVHNEIACVVEGRIRYYLFDLPAYDAPKGQLIFRPSGGECSYEALSDALVVVFRTNSRMMLCNNFSVEKLYGLNVADKYFEQEEKKHIGTLEMNSRMWHFLNGIIDCIGDGLKCTCWFEIKIRELEHLMRVYYTKEALYDFLYMILSGDTTFSEYVRRNWQQFHSVNDFAESMHMTPKQFSTRFVKVFGQTPYRWMSDSKTRVIHKEITSTKKPFKSIAIECGFITETEFSRFCKKKLGKTPTELREQS